MINNSIKRLRIVRKIKKERKVKKVNKLEKLKKQARRQVKMLINISLKKNSMTTQSYDKNKLFSLKIDYHERNLSVTTA